MFCSSCGKQIPDDSKYCFYCGSKVVTQLTPQPQPPVVPEPKEVRIEKVEEPKGAEPKAEEPKVEKNILDELKERLFGQGEFSARTVRISHIILGIVFILGGLMPYLLQSGSIWDSGYINELYSKYDYSLNVLSIISIINSCFSFFNRIFYFTASAVSLVTGIALLQNRKGAGTVAMVGAVLHAISVVYTLVAVVMVYAAPEAILSIYAADASMVKAGVDLLRNEPEFLSLHLNPAYQRMVMSIILIAAVFIFKRIFSTEKHGLELYEKADNAHINLAIMMPVLALFSSMETILSNYALNMYSEIAVAAHSYAKSFVNETIASLPLYLMILFIVLGMVAQKVDYWKLSLSVTAGLIACGSVLFGLTFKDAASFGVSEYYYDQFWAMSVWYFWSVLLMLVVCNFWITSTARGYIPTWLQVLLCVLITPAFAMCEIAKLQHLNLTPEVPLGYIAVILLIGGVSTISAAIATRNDQPKTDELAA